MVFGGVPIPGRWTLWLISWADTATQIKFQAELSRSPFSTVPLGVLCWFSWIQSKLYEKGRNVSRTRLELPVEPTDKTEFSALFQFTWLRRLLVLRVALHGKKHIKTWNHEWFLKWKTNSGKFSLELKSDYLIKPSRVFGQFWFEMQTYSVAMDLLGSMTTVGTAKFHCKVELNSSLWFSLPFSVTAVPSLPKFPIFPDWLVSFAKSSENCSKSVRD